MCVLQRNWGIANLQKTCDLLTIVKKSKSSYSAILLSKGTGGIAICNYLCVLLRNCKFANICNFQIANLQFPKGTGGIAIFAAKNLKTNMCDVSLTKGIVGIANL